MDNEISNIRMWKKTREKLEKLPEEERKKTIEKMKKTQTQKKDKEEYTGRLNEKTLNKLNKIEDPEKREKEKTRILRRNYYQHCRNNGLEMDFRYKRQLTEDIECENNYNSKLLKCDKYINYYTTLKEKIIAEHERGDNSIVVDCVPCIGENDEIDNSE